MIRHTAGTILFVATVAAAALTQATYVRAASKYDGAWSIVIVTRTGPRNQAYRTMDLNHHSPEVLTNCRFRLPWPPREYT